MQKMQRTLVLQHGELLGLRTVPWGTRTLVLADRCTSLKSAPQITRLMALRLLNFQTAVILTTSMLEPWIKRYRSIRLGVLDAPCTQGYFCGLQFHGCSLRIEAD